MKFPDVIDSTILVTARACEKKAEYSFFHNLQKPGRSTHLDFGGAFAKGVEAARKSFFHAGKSRNEALTDGLNAAWKDYETLEDPVFTDSPRHAKCLGTLFLGLEGYFQNWPLGDDGFEPMPGGGIEFSFAVPIPGLVHPDHGGDILYGGRFDGLGMYLGMPAGVDEKTTKGFGENWITQWALRNQFLGYCWGARQYGFKLDQFLIRGIGIQKKEIKYLQALVSYPDYLLERFYSQMVSDVTRLIRTYQAQSFGYNFGDTCTSFGICPFADLCKSRVPSEWFSAFDTRDWQPLKAKDEGEE